MCSRPIVRLSKVSGRSDMLDLSNPLEAIRRAAAPHGLNLVAALPAARYDDAVAVALRTAAIPADAVPFAVRSIVLIGNGGGEFWHAFTDHADRHPGWRERANPLDDFSREIIAHEVAPAAQAAGARCAAIYPFINGGVTLNFIELAKIAGLGGPSLLGVVVHPRFGPWIAFRAALIVDCELDAPGPAIGFDPCPGCVTQSCLAACPAGAVAYPAGWDIPRCLTHRVEQESDCAPRCHARAGCVLGPEHRYPDDELAYHQRRALAAMRPWYAAHLRPPR